MRKQPKMLPTQLKNEFFKELTAWETQHHQMLVKELESLQEVYWTTNRFAPF